MQRKLKCGLLGEKLGHSYSKQIHAHFSDYEYELYSVPRDVAEKMIKSGELSGLNVTIPYKELAYSLCDELDAAAREAKSVNTVVHRNGKIFGYNTDVFGFMSMVERAGISFKGKNVLILGSGGTSKTATLAAERMGAAHITVCSRSGEVNYESVYALSDTEIVVNTTPVGMYPKNGASPIDLSRFPRCSGVVDVIYNPAKTALVFEAEKLGIPWVSGLHMLAAQGFRAAEIFTDSKLNKELIDKAVKSVSRDMKNIVLIGMPGGGKSSVAKAVGVLMQREVVDTDEVLRERFGAPSEILKTQGEDAFRRLETEVLSEISRERGLVISTGGGVVEREENLPLLSQNGKLYLIERDLESLVTEDRPLSSDVATLYEKRKEKYARFADVRIDNNGTVLQAAEKIVEDFNK